MTAERASEYLAVLSEMDAHRIEAGGKPPHWNRLVNRLQTLYLELRQSPDGRQAIGDLMDSESVTVREWSAGHALAWEPAKAQDALERLAAEGKGLASFEAGITLREFRRGKLKLDWIPKRAVRAPEPEA
ncbi:MAG: DUF2019 domain-containing protein [Candidatus Dormibacteraeota bacterium]|uniref:DUF2019 domain-containing protein n=1 Tax=Candidatus Amunia macphersoniae TaxID=3127014 RepID=A0A934KQI3_9BACT|nr:DUF2019 domain-containing protein [Candidatus Dormibacteraeota bacterium]